MEKNKKILIVDDEPDALMMLEMRLSHAGYTVLKAENGKAAITVARVEHPDLIVLDILLPDMNGEEVAEELKSNPKTRDIPVMFLTCLFTKKEESRDGHKVSGNVFFAKPYNPEELLVEIEKELVLRNEKD